MYSISHHHAIEFTPSIVYKRDFRLITSKFQPRSSPVVSAPIRDAQNTDTRKYRRTLAMILLAFQIQATTLTVIVSVFGCRHVFQQNVTQQNNNFKRLTLR